MRTLCGVLAYLTALATIFVGGLVGMAALLSPPAIKHKAVAYYHTAPTITESPTSPPSSTVAPQSHRIGPAIVHRVPEATRHSGPPTSRVRTAEKKLRKDRAARPGPSWRNPLKQDDHITALGYAPIDARHSRNY